MKQANKPGDPWREARFYLGKRLAQLRKNCPGHLAFFGEPFTLQRRVGGEWAAMELVNDLIFILPAYMLEPDASEEHTFHEVA